MIRLIQKNLVQDEPWQQTGVLYLAEIFLSGLLRPVLAGNEQSRNRQPPPQYDFVDGVRDVLLGTIPISEAQAVGEQVAAAVFKQLPAELQERVNADIERRYGDSLSYFEAFLIPDLPWGHSAAAEIFPFAQVTRQVLQRWGGAHAALVDEIGNQVQDSNQSNDEEYAFAFAALNEHLDYFQQKILDTFIQQEHVFQLQSHPRETGNVDEATLAEDDISVEVTDYHLTEFSDAEFGYKNTVISEPYSSFELYVRINFSVEIRYVDHDASYPDLEEDIPTFGEVVPNQMVQAVAVVNLLFSETNEVEPELVELKVDEPIWIDLDQRPDATVPIPPLQPFEFEVATITLEHPPVSTTDLPLENFDFETVSLSLTHPEDLEWGEALGIIDQAMRVATGKSLTDLQQEIIQAVWEDRSYDEVADTSGYSVSHVRKVAVAMFRTLSKQMERSISRKTLRDALIQFAALSHKAELSLSSERRQTQQFVEDLGNDVTLEMVLIPGGSFLMGSPEDELELYNNEGPQHSVTVPSFLIGKYLITQRQWQVVAALPQVNRPLDPAPSRFKNANRPVENVSWFDAVEFCDRLSQLTGRPYRLPTEAEWEYACRAETTTPFHFGETITTDLANYRGTDDQVYEWSGSYGQGPKGIYRQETTPVGRFPANPFGLYDMHGNVWEWCLDHWHDDYIDAPIDGSTWIGQTAENSARRVLRGGSWGIIPRDCRSATRDCYSPANRNAAVGFRVVCSPHNPLSPVRGNDVFISYSLKDQAFLQQFHEAFRRVNQKPWVDSESIEKGEE